MLQQTQVKTVIPYFKKFTKKFKTLKSLSKSDEKKVLKLWEGLGYYRRAKNLLATAKVLVNKYNSKLPKEIDKIKTFPGVGDYTANALLGLVHNFPVIAVDGNVKRIISRILNKKIIEINFNKFVELNKKKLFNTNRNSDFVEALMEFGALICKFKDPKCNICKLNKSCKYFNSSHKIKIKNNQVIEKKSYNIFCYINKKKQIALTNKNNIGFLKQCNLPKIREAKKNVTIKDWKLLTQYQNSISNKKLNIKLYYKFSKTIPSSFNWYSISINQKEFVPTFTKKIIKQVSVLFS